MFGAWVKYGGWLRKQLRGTNVRVLSQDLIDDTFLYFKFNPFSFTPDR
jgi:hypothetical protein